MPILIGQSLGRYHILEQLGEGGMATVYKAYDTRLERDVAVKVIRRGAFPPEQLERILKRFEREAKALSRLSHPNIVGVIDFGEYRRSPYLVMQYLPGGTLKQRLGKPIAWQEAARRLLPIARALQYAHEQGIIHRDVKPSNILITLSGEPMLTDFGIAKLLESEETQTLTGTGIGVGTPEYMAPEQWTGQAGPQSDIYSLGVILYEMITGRKPYMADTPAAILLKQTSDPLPLPQKFVPDLPEGVEKVLIKALAKNTADRYLDMGAFAAALEELSAGRIPKPSSAEPSSGFDRLPGSTPQDQTTMDLLDASGKAERPAAVRKWLLPVGIVAGIGCIALAIGGIALLSRQLQTRPTVVPSLQSPAAVTQALVDTQLPVFTQPPVNTKVPVATQPPVLPPTDTPRPANTPTPRSTSTSTPRPTNAPSPTYTPNPTARMVYIPEGNFTMGDTAAHAQSACESVSAACVPNTDITFTDESPPHSVYLNAYRIDQTEVTNAMYSLCVRAGRCASNGAGSDNYPAVNVSWSDASTYCAWAGGRLPTEAEWEKAARGTDERIFPWGNSPISCSLANYTPSNGGSCGGNHVMTVGSYPGGASPYGALDMAGNVWEWVADWFAPGYSSSPQSNPTGPTSGTHRVMRGGSWMNSEGFMIPTGRGNNRPEIKTDSLGFRCAANP